jgi:hypothetical protein
MSMIKMSDAIVYPRAVMIYETKVSRIVAEIYHGAVPIRSTQLEHKFVSTRNVLSKVNYSPIALSTVVSSRRLEVLTRPAKPRAARELLHLITIFVLKIWFLD